MLQYKQMTDTYTYTRGHRRTGFTKLVIFSVISGTKSHVEYALFSVARKKTLVKRVVDLCMIDNVFGSN